MPPDRVIDTVEQLHRAIDAMVAPLTQRHVARLQCRSGCSGCCVDDLSVFAVEAAVITRHHATLLATEAPHPVGRCAFLDVSGRCRIYAQRPYVCRTQGLPLRWTESLDDKTTRELRDICELNETPQPIEDLAPEECWTLGPVEDRLRSLQEQVEPGVRVKLREMFGR